MIWAKRKILNCLFTPMIFQIIHDLWEPCKVCFDCVWYECVAAPLGPMKPGIPSGPSGPTSPFSPFGPGGPENRVKTKNRRKV